MTFLVGVVLSRFLWIIPVTYGMRFLSPALRRRDPYPPLRVPLVMSWAGMRGVVSLAAALSLPAEFPDREFILLAIFAVIPRYRARAGGDARATDTRNAL